MATESRTLVVLALIANGVIAVVKFIAAGISGSSAMLAEGFHSVADTGNQIFLLRGNAVSRWAPDTKHPFGRGKELYFWSFMVAVFLFVGGAVVAFLEGWEQLRHPVHEDTGLAFSLVVLAIAALVEGFLALRPALRAFDQARGSRSLRETIREARDPSLLVVVFEDTAAMFGLLLAAAGLILTDATGWAGWDGIASMLIGVLLASTAWVLAAEMKALLVGEAATRQERSEIRAAVLSIPEVVSIGRLLTMQLSPTEILVNLDVALDAELSSDQAEEAVDRIEAGIQSAVPEASRVFVELESGR
jgi:cation diffusion facilitator family transporter